MAIIIQEKDESISVDSSNKVTLSRVLQMEGDSLVEILQSDVFPKVNTKHPELENCYSDSISITPNGNLGRKVQATVTVSYKTVSEPDGGSSSEEEAAPEMSFDCGGGTMHLTHALAQKQVKGELNANGMIGWNGKSGQEMEITGVDVPCAQLRETYTRVMKSSKITPQYKKKVAAMVGKVNANNFKGWDAGEVMFLGMSYSAPVKGSEIITVTYNFSIQLNETQTIDDTQITKTGYEYVWMISRTEANESQIPQSVIDSIYVATVCEKADFADLGLGQ